MDFLRSRAIQALKAAALLAAGVAHGADCSAIDGTYRYESAAVRGQEPHHLSELVAGADTRKLYRSSTGNAGPKSLNPTETLRRPKVTFLADKVALKAEPSGATTLRFMDAAGVTLAEIGINSTGKWTCKDSRLERSSERTAGLGDSIRTERMDESLERNAAGELVYRTTVVILDPPGGKTVHGEARFSAAR